MSPSSTASRRFLALALASWMLLPGGCDLSPGIDFPAAPGSESSGSDNDSSGSDGISIDGGIDGNGAGGAENLSASGAPTLSTETTDGDANAIGGGGSSGDDAGGDEDADYGGASGEEPKAPRESKATGGSTP